MKIRCMDCKRDLGEKDGHGVDGISDGLCPECYLIRRKEIEEMKIQDRAMEENYENYLRRNDMTGMKVKK